MRDCVKGPINVYRGDIDEAIERPLLTDRIRQFEEVVLSALFALLSVLALIKHWLETLH